MTSVLECSGVRRSLASGMKPRYTYMIHPSDTPYDTPRPQFRRAYWVQNCSTVDPSAQCVAPQERWNLSNLSPPCTLMSPELVLTRIWSTAPSTAGRGKCLERREVRRRIWVEGHLGQSHISPHSIPPPPWVRWFLFEISIGCFLSGAGTWP